MPLQNKAKAAPQGITEFLRPVAIGMAIGIGVCLCLLMLFSLLMSVKDIPESLISPIGIVCVAAGSFAGGCFTARLVGEKGLILGLLCGAILFFIITLASFATYGDGFSAVAITELIASLCAGALGGIFGVNQRRRRRAH